MDRDAVAAACLSAQAVHRVAQTPLVDLLLLAVLVTGAAIRVGLPRVHWAGSAALAAMYMWWC
jgi:hypothetical protein